MTNTVNRQPPMPLTSIRVFFGSFTFDPFPTDDRGIVPAPLPLAHGTFPDRTFWPFLLSPPPQHRGVADVSEGGGIGAHTRFLSFTLGCHTTGEYLRV